jgi:hypothetical protein
MESTRYSSQFNGTWSLKKDSNIKFHENPSSGAELFQVGGRTDGLTDGHDEANSRFRQFSKAPKNSEFQVQTWCIVITGFRKPKNDLSEWKTRIFNFLFTMCNHLYNNPDL